MAGLSGWETRELHGASELAARRALLSSRGLSVPGGEDRVLGLFEQDRLLATGSITGKTLVGIAVDRSIEGEGGAAAILSALISSAVASGLRHLFLYTLSKEASRFANLGFSPISSVPEGAALLEWGSPCIRDWLRELKRASEGKPHGAGALVVNCNPFTLGHRKLVEFAASNSPWLYIFVVEEDKSIFPFSTRYELVKRGTADLKNISVLPGGPYIISSATFPTYFIRPEPGKESERAVAMHADLDLAVFREHIAPALNISTRYVGTEPYCPTTAAYNRAMKSVLSPGPRRESSLAGPALEVVEMPRFTIEGTPVSASRVRDLLRSGKIDEATALLPASTIAWLESPEASPVLQRLRSSNARH
ncbi:MAG TPA: [citrate (pro-3S)-lyase] ligase [Rectinemataceae bacterium]